MTLPPIDLEFLNEGSTQGSAMPSARATGLRPQPPAASSRSGVTIAADLCVMALLVLAVWLGLVVTP